MKSVITAFKLNGFVPTGENQICIFCRQTIRYVSSAGRILCYNVVFFFFSLKLYSVRNHAKAFKNTDPLKET